MRGGFFFVLCVLRVGMFWNYLEETHLRPVVREESQPPCSQIYFRDQKNLLFEVTYYKKRINFETYHALTDGTGAMQFVKSLVFYYLKEQYPEKIQGSPQQVQFDATKAELSEDSFEKYYSDQGKGIKIPKYKAHQLKYRKTEYNTIHLTEGIMSVKELLVQPNPMERP